MLGGMEKLGDRLAKRLRAIIEPYSGGRPLVSARPLDNTMFMMWDACVPSFVSLSLYRLHPIKGPVTLRVDADLVTQLVDRFYGGHSSRGAGDRREFTPTETRLAVRIAETVVAALVDCWSELAPVEAVLLGRETNVGQAEIMAGEAEVVVQAFEIDLGDKHHTTIEIVYPKDGLAALDIAGTDKSAAQDTRPADPVWQAGLANRLDDVRFPARTVLARPNLKIAELVALKPGDIIPIHIARHLPLLIGERVFAHGSIGEQDGCAAFMIEKLA
ncbi:FliM/FliN family flagellar motor switch protein [Sphingobium sp. H33]|uniref:Flagellar motor switch protein FliM n=1 Tax=Sphingobium nicotianae TaxID=2782607 RepID=A0A9X1DAJ5_9SPHN|nr:FliM/FliN family flagellar motor switch protein [Sphingobium nicotianae]